MLNRLEIEKDEEVLQLVMESAESFNIAGIKRCSLLSESLRERILHYATRPQPLIHQCRLLVHRLLSELALKSQAKLIKKVRSITCPLYKKRRPLKKRKNDHHNSHHHNNMISATVTINDENNRNTLNINIHETTDDDIVMNDNDGNDNDYESIELLEGTSIDIQRLKGMTTDEMEDEFLTGGNGDPERLKLLTYLLQHTSTMTSPNIVPGSEVLKRLNQLPLPIVLKNYLTYEMSSMFPSMLDIITSTFAPLEHSRSLTSSAVSVSASPLPETVKQ